METKEKSIKALNGWATLGVLVLAACAICYSFFSMVSSNHQASATSWLVWGLSIILWSIALKGFFTLEPNKAAVMTLLGKYKGTVKTSGFCWVNPLYTKQKISLRSRNLNGVPIKVNDLRGNPIEIAVVVVWKVDDTAHAVFDVDKYSEYVNVQCESALRHLAMAYPYDEFDGDTMSLRGSTDEVSVTLEKEIQERVDKAGVRIEEARLSHLAYAQEIASVMLQRQQADAIVAARSRIVDGAVGMVEMAIEKLEESEKIELDEERKAAMVSNLLVVLCGHDNAQPVINTGTLYS